MSDDAKHWSGVNASKVNVSDTMPSQAGGMQKKAFGEVSSSGVEAV